jgi:D-sedoheptulose 7-phosphate isomerase
MDKQWINNYYKELTNALGSDELADNLIKFKEIVLHAKLNGKKMIFAGNGASNTIATHGYLDFMNQLGIASISINDGSYITAAANDFGYENIFKRSVDLLVDEGDIVVLISSSGRSANVLNAAKGAREKGTYIVTFSGFKEDNPLGQLGDINFWVDSDKYNIVESVHNAWLVSTVDLIIKDFDEVGIHGLEFDVAGIDNNDTGINEDYEF